MKLPSIAVVYQHSYEKEQAKAVAELWQLPYAGDINAIKPNSDFQFLLVQTEQQLQLVKVDESKLGAVAVDFASGAVAHRHKFGGGRGQEIARAIGLKHGFNPTVLDATAGLGRDAFVLASLGCQVTMLERHNVVAALLQDGLNRAKQAPALADWIGEALQLKVGSLLDDHAPQQPVDVVYLDPMYPHKTKSAMVKKEMRVFQTLVGADDDADELLIPALKLARYRVVVKRPNYAEPLANKTPSTSISMKKNRFDVYVNQAIPKSS